MIIVIEMNNIQQVVYKHTYTLINAQSRIVHISLSRVNHVTHYSTPPPKWLVQIEVKRLGQHTRLPDRVTVTVDLEGETVSCGDVESTLLESSDVVVNS